jgi:threonine dehydrogenase-like Zn-dependent dehydrogenase
MSATCRHLHKAASPGEVSLEESRRVRSAAGEVRIAPLFVGLCGSDLRLVRNEKSHRPGGFGHEVVARVIETGAAVSGFSHGDLVTVNPVDADDDEDIIGYNGSGFLGTEFVVNERVLAQQRLIRLHAETDPMAAVFAEPLACCVRAQRELDVPLPGARVVIVGAGSFGQLHYLLARHAGAAQLLLTARTRARLDAAVSRGIALAEHVASSSEAHPLRGRAEVVIVTANGIEAVREAARWAQPGATLLLFGGLGSGDVHDQVDFGRLRRDRAHTRAVIDGKHLSVVGSYGTRNADFRRAIELIEGDALDVTRLITHIVALADLPHSLGGFAEGAIDGRAVLKLIVKCA